MVYQKYAEAALARYELGDSVGLELVNISENATFKISVGDGRRLALRVHRPGYHAQAAIASELAWMTALRRDGYALTPQVLAGRDGDFIQTVRVGAEPPRHVVMSMWEDGHEPQIGDDLKPAFEQLGAITARMHSHARQWQRPANFERLSWDFDSCLGEDAPHWGRWREGLGLNGEALALFSRTVAVIEKRLERYGKEASRFGLIHGDTRLANLLVDGERIKILDFDDCGFGWFMYDAATTLSFYEHDPQVPALLEAWKTGYRQVARLSKADEDEIATFIMLRRLLLVAWIASHRDVPFAQSLGANYSLQSLELCEAFLTQQHNSRFVKCVW